MESDTIVLMDFDFKYRGIPPLTFGILRYPLREFACPRQRDLLVAFGDCYLSDYSPADIYDIEHTNTHARARVSIERITFDTLSSQLSAPIRPHLSAKES